MSFRVNYFSNQLWLAATRTVAFNTASVKKMLLQNAHFLSRKRMEFATSVLLSRIIVNLPKEMHIMDTRCSLLHTDEKPEREKILTVPNALSLTRLGLSPVLGHMIISEDFTAACAVFFIAGFTDLIDGWIARTFPSQSSKFGSFLDPFADKLLVGVSFVTLTWTHLIPVSLTALIIFRDLVLICAGLHVRFQSLEPPKTIKRYFDASLVSAQLTPTLISKVNTAIQLILLGTTISSAALTWNVDTALHLLWYITAATTVLSALSYVISGNSYKIFKHKLKKM